MPSLYSLDESDALHSRDASLNGPWRNADAICHQFLRWEWKVISLPPMIRELQQNIHIKLVQSQCLLALQKTDGKPTQPASIRDFPQRCSSLPKSTPDWLEVCAFAMPQQ